jgi:O-antigen ligase
MTFIPTIVLSTLILVAPLGVAGQNIGIGLAVVLFAVFSKNHRGRSLKKVLRLPFYGQFTALSLLLVVPILSATITQGNTKEASGFLLGYLLVLAVFYMALGLAKAQFKETFLLKLASLVLAVIGLISLSQFLIGWKLDGIEITHQIKRAQGFYSHPLTLAYASLIIVPTVVARLAVYPKDTKSILMALSTLCIVITSQSITVIVLTGVISLGIAFKLLKPKQFGILCAIGSILAVLAVSIPNPVSEKFQKVLSGERSDHETPYPDDRIAFWHAHWEMFKDAPILGHGSGITKDMRRPYYEKIGLGSIKRMYEAHNMYLQTAVEGGFLAVIGLVSFLAWWWLVARSARSLSPWIRTAAMYTPLTFGAGGLTQNALQDSEVRYVLLCMCAFQFALVVRSQNEHGSERFNSDTGTV